MSDSAVEAQTGRTWAKWFFAASTRLFDAWRSPTARKHWLGSAKLSIRTARRGHSLRITWGDGSNVEVMLLPKPGRRTQINVQHGKLRSRRAVERMRTHWKARLAALTEVTTG